MSITRRRGLSQALTRTLAAAVMVILAIMPLMPLVDAARHTDDRCCANGVCCCRPRPLPASWAVRAACRCGGHDEHEAGLPTMPPFEVAVRFGLSVPSSVVLVVPVVVFSPRPGYLPPLDHPPGPLLAVAC
jgi:hypothetical protein